MSTEKFIKFTAIILVGLAIMSAIAVGVLYFKVNERECEPCHCPCDNDCSKCDSDCSKCEVDCSKCPDECASCPPNCSLCDSPCEDYDCDLCAKCSTCSARCNLCETDCNRCVEPPPVPKTYLWIRASGNDADNLSYTESEAYCVKNGGRIANVGEVKEAKRRGMAYCKFGWFSEHTSCKGYSSQIIRDPTCYDGTNGDGLAWDCDPDGTQKLATYCFGPKVPDDPNVRRSIAIDFM